MHSRSYFLAALATGVLGIAHAAPVYQNDFENDGSQGNALQASGTLSALSRASLPTDGSGLTSANQSMWLGALGANLGKSSTTPETVTLSLTGLTMGARYEVSFDLFIGASWDGVAGGYGPDRWSLGVMSGATSATLVDAVFSNCGTRNQLCGAGSPQTYADDAPLGGTSGEPRAPATGADAYNDSNGLGGAYAIYSFGQGAGNPALSFIAGAEMAGLVFQRMPGVSDSSDEYWALDNITVTAAIPEPSAWSLLVAGLAITGLVRKASDRLKTPS